MLDRWLLGDGLWSRVLRFALVGGVSTVAYGLLTLLVVEFAKQPPLIGTVIGYLLVIPLNYLLQRTFTFRSSNAVSSEIPRFLLVHAANILASFVAMYIVTELLRTDYRWGVALTMTFIPVLVFIVMNRWVFGKPRNTADMPKS